MVMTTRLLPVRSPPGADRPPRGGAADRAHRSCSATQPRGVLRGEHRRGAAPARHPGHAGDRGGGGVRGWRGRLGASRLRGHRRDARRGSRIVFALGQSSQEYKGGCAPTILGGYLGALLLGIPMAYIGAATLSPSISDGGYDRGVGAVLGAALGIVVGTAVGATIGWQASKERRDALLDDLTLAPPPPPPAGAATWSKPPAALHHGPRPGRGRRPLAVVAVLTALSRRAAR